MHTTLETDRASVRVAAQARPRGHIVPLDGLRGFAAMLVVLSHLPQVGLLTRQPPQSGTFGVMIFFVLSGFLMGHLYLFKPFDTASAFHYIAARLSRVVPAYYLVVIGCYLLSRYIGPEFIYYFSTGEFVKHMLFLGSDYVFWSIPPEIEFYFVFLGIWFLFATRNIVRVVPLLAIVTALIIVAHPAFPGGTVLNKLHIFLVGVGVAVLRHMIDISRISKVAASCTQLAGVVLILLVVAGVVPVGQTDAAFGWERGRVYSSLPMALAFGAIVLAFTVETRFANAVFGNRFARKLGAYSFSIYLLHVPVMAGVENLLDPLDTPHVAQIVAALAATVAVSSASFHFVEKPSQKIMRRVIVSTGRIGRSTLCRMNIAPAWLRGGGTAA